MSTFADLGVPAKLVARLQTQGIESPFPIQAAAIPDARLRPARPRTGLAGGAAPSSSLDPRSHA